MTDTAGAVEAVLFDFGNVLIEWDPRHLYRKLFTLPGGKPDEKRVKQFLSKVCPWNGMWSRTAARSRRQPDPDPGQPAYKALIEAYYKRFQEMIPGPIEGSVAAWRRSRQRACRPMG